MEVIERRRRRYYINVGETKTPEWAPVGAGFTKFKEEKNATAVHVRFFHESDERTENDGYTSAIAYAFDLRSDSPAEEKLRIVCDEELTGEGAKVEVLSVDLFRKTDTPDTYSAAVRRYCVIPEECGGGDDVLEYEGKLYADGDISTGIYVGSTGKFLPDELKEEVDFG